MIAGVATVTIVVSTRIMKKPRHSANSAGHGSFSSGPGGRGRGSVLGHDEVNTRPPTMRFPTARLQVAA